MKFVRCEDGVMRMKEAKNIIDEMNDIAPLSKVYLVDIPLIKKKVKNGTYFNNMMFSVATIGGQGVFWKIFLTYIFPWMLDIAKVYCAIRIAQAFYQEKRGGRDEGTGFGAVVQYGKWYLIFYMMPYFVELIDEVGGTMFHQLRDGKADLKPTMVDPYRR